MSFLATFLCELSITLRAVEWLITGVRSLMSLQFPALVELPLTFGATECFNTSMYSFVSFKSPFQRKFHVAFRTFESKQLLVSVNLQGHLDILCSASLI